VADTKGPFGSRIRRGGEGRENILIKSVFGSQGEGRDFKIILLFYLKLNLKRIIK